MLLQCYAKLHIVTQIMLLKGCWDTSIITIENKLSRIKMVKNVYDIKIYLGYRHDIIYVVRNDILFQCITKTS